MVFENLLCTCGGNQPFILLNIFKVEAAVDVSHCLYQIKLPHSLFVYSVLSSKYKYHDITSVFKRKLKKNLEFSCSLRLHYEKPEPTHKSAALLLESVGEGGMLKYCAGLRAHGNYQTLS